MNYDIGQYVLDNWRIVRELGEGSYGKVFEIVKESGPVTVTSALKVITIPKSATEVVSIKNEGLDDESIRKYFKELVDEVSNEIVMMASVKNHPNVVRYEDHEIIENTESFGWDVLTRMELLTPMDTYVSEHTMSEIDILTMGEQICSALEYCHKKGMIHRDIKPANLFVNEIGYFKLGDFGIARSVEKTTGEMSQKGTLNYMAPEIYMNKPYGASVDIYSLGMVMYRMLNMGRAPFMPMPPITPSRSDRDNAMVRRMGGEILPAPASASAMVADLLIKACDADPNKRYKNAAEFKKAIARVRTELEDRTQQDATVAAVQTPQAVPVQPVAAQQVAAPMQQPVSPVQPVAAQQISAPVQQPVAPVQPVAAQQVAAPMQQPVAPVQPVAAQQAAAPVQPNTSKKSKKALIIIPIVVAAIAACVALFFVIRNVLDSRSNSSNNYVASSGKTDKPSKNNDSDVNSGANSGANSGEDVDNNSSVIDDSDADEPVYLNIYRTSYNISLPNVDQVQKVADSINEKLLERGSNVQINICDISSSYYSDTLIQAIESGECDLFWTADWFDTQIATGDLYKAGYVYDLTNIIEGSQLEDTMEYGVWTAAQYDGRTYFVPIYRELYTGYDLTVPEDVVNNYGWDLSNVTTLADLEPMLEQLKEDGCVYPYTSGSRALFSSLYIDKYDFFERSSMLAVDRNTNTVVNPLQSDDYYDFAFRMSRWVEKGYMSTDDVDKLMYSDGLRYSYDWGFTLVDCPVGDNIELDNRFSRNMYLIEGITDNYINSNSILASCYAVSAQCTTKKAKAAVEFLTILFTDSEIADLFTYGIEGEDYTIERGRVYSNYENYSHSQWESSSVCAVTPQAGTAVTDSYYRYKNSMAEVSCAAGFRFDPTNVQYQYDKCRQILEDEAFILENGGYSSTDVNAGINYLLQLLNDAGYQDVLDEARRQYNEWK